jgi:hypothetical protein
MPRPLTHYVSIPCRLFSSFFAHANPVDWTCYENVSAPTAGLDARAGIEVELQNCAVAQLNQRLAGTIAISCRARVSSTGSEASRAMNCAWAGFGTVIGSLNSAAAPVRNL